MPSALMGLSVTHTQEQIPVYQTLTNPSSLLALLLSGHISLRSEHLTLSSLIFLHHLRRLL